MARPFSEYSKSYECVEFKREDGILEMRLHTKGAEFIWGLKPHQELPEVFREVGADRENRIVILTGTGSVFTGPQANPATRALSTSLPPKGWYAIMRETKQMQMNQLDIDVPMIAAINGPAYRHMEWALLCDITIASEDAVFEDAAHVPQGVLPPGDGMNIIVSELIGLNRARYLHLMGQQLSAKEAQAFGMINEIVQKDQVLSRAWAVARSLAKKPDILLRHSRLLMIQRFKKRVQEDLSEHLLFEGMAQMDGDGFSSGA